MARNYIEDSTMDTDFSDPDDLPVGENRALLTEARFSPMQNPNMENAKTDIVTSVTEKPNSARGTANTNLGFKTIFRYPKGVYFCLGNEFSERFSYYGMRAVLTLYLITVHDLEPSRAKLLFHAFVSLAYFMPIFGSILADGFIGRYKVILYISIVYCLGHVLLTVGAVTTTGSAAMQILDFAGLFIIAVATGGIKPCVSAFAADQFPEHMYNERKQFFSFFYFSINLGALLSKIITPILRRHHCLGEEHCFPLAFGVPAIFMFTAAVVFWGGTPFYKIVPKAKNNVIVQVCQCVAYALRKRFSPKQRTSNRVQKDGKNAQMHWLDYASPRYDKELIDDVKTIFGLLLLFVPVVFFWSLFDQLGSTWVLQANQMNGRVGQLTLLPDQMSVWNPFLIILMVPTLEGIVYPLLAKCNCLVKPLRRMGWGGMLAAVSFAMAGCLQMQIDLTSVVQPRAGYGRLMVAAESECRVTHMDDGISQFNWTLKAGDISPPIDAKGAIHIEFDQHVHYNFTIRLAAGKGTFAFIPKNLSGAFPETIQYDLKKTAGGKTRLYILPLASTKFHFISAEQNGKVKATLDLYRSNATSTSYVDLEPDLIGSNEYEIYYSDRICSGNCSSGDENKRFLLTYTAHMGAAEVLLVDLEAHASRLIELIPANTVSILWQIPQYLVITLGEALFSITGLEFSYSEASPNMKSVLTAIWLLTTAFGNVIDMAISGGSLLNNRPAEEFFVYACLMTVVMFAFIGLAWRYKSARRPSEEMDMDLYEEQNKNTAGKINS